MAYKSSLDILEVNGLIFSDVLDGDFAPARSGDKYTREEDSNGSFQDFENPNNSGEFTLVVSIAKNRNGERFLKELRRMFEEGETFTLNRNNKNKGGAKERYDGCLIMNDGSSTKGKNGVLGRREWKVSYETYHVTEGAN
ncbi:hypothetical protein [Cetobacterium sp.]|uniref:hypothetical protein n=1 Tax=Cetobacterium sp. TaxID=2071632 RepID=UPI003EE7DF5E